MKDSFFGNSIWIIVLLLFFGTTVLFVRGDAIDEMKALTGYSMAQIKDVKETCEKDLQRSKSCVIVVSAVVKENK